MADICSHGNFRNLPCLSQLGDSVFMAQTAEVVIPVSQNDLQGGLEQIQTSQGASFYQPTSAGINVLQVSMTLFPLELLVVISYKSEESRCPLASQASEAKVFMWMQGVGGSGG